MEKHGVSQYRLAVDVGVAPRRINEIVLGKRGITADTALRLGRYFGNDPGFWMGLQVEWDLALARERLGGRLESEVRVFDPLRPPPRRGRPKGKPQWDTEPEPERRGRRDDTDHLFID